MTWIITAGGNQYDYADESATTITIEDIAHHLGGINRYLGGTKFPYSVAEHSVLISRWVLLRTGDPHLAFRGLMHDSPEAYCGDAPSPLKPFLGDGYKTVYTEAARRIAKTIGDLPGNLALPAIVKEADMRICLDERAQLLPSCSRKWHISIENAVRLGVTIEGWSAAQARNTFLCEFHQLKTEMRKL